ncbi:hypothetical protein I79_005457 [Cricetulus griseus]|uniref:Uncharacterized protein n=1 Tax=Cricetulus griseus TaxID=10029 RepID=G3H582_CRIGR|nr:hypothetical protein I79_005457 [Cricetulus griseus]
MRASGSFLGVISCCDPKALVVWWLDSFRKIRTFLDGHQTAAKQIVPGGRGGWSSAAHSLRVQHPHALSCCQLGVSWPLVRKHSEQEGFMKRKPASRCPKGKQAA